MAAKPKKAMMSAELADLVLGFDKHIEKEKVVICVRARVLVCVCVCA